MPLAVSSRKQRTPVASTTGVHHFGRPCAEKESLPQPCACGDDIGTAIFASFRGTRRTAHFSPFLIAQLHDGAYQVTHTFPHGGAYRLYADFTPPNAAQTVEQIALKVSGNERAQQPLTADTVMTKSVDGISVTLAPDKALKPGSELMLNFKVADAKTGQPVTNLQKYLGEYAHFVIISADLKEFLHAHPMSRATHNAGGEHPHAPGTKPHAHQAEAASPAEVAAHTTFPQAGTYKVWAQFQRAEQVITMPFVINVPASGDTAVVAKDEGQPHSAAHKH